MFAEERIWEIEVRFVSNVQNIWQFMTRPLRADKIRRNEHKISLRENVN